MSTSNWGWLGGSAIALGVTWSALIASDGAPPAGIRLGETVFRDSAAVVAAGARCGTREPTEAQKAALRLAMRAVPNQPAATADNPIVIPVQFIHLTDGTEGFITEEQRVDQIQVLNDAYNQYGFSFCYDPNGSYPPITRNNTSWFRMEPDSTQEIACKSALGVTPDRVLNFYTCRPRSGSLLGWATFPFPRIDRIADGVVCLDQSLPGGTAAPFNEGDTATHEVGHWLGLYHTFEGCGGLGDEVDDTQDHSFPDYGCPTTGPSCDPMVSSPVRNFMNYVDDPCMDEFTPGQGARMAQIVQRFRPSLGSVGCGGLPVNCALERVAQAAQKLIPFPLSNHDMDGLRKYRDLVLNHSNAGRELTQLYYRHSAALAQLMLTNQKLTGESLAFLAGQLPQLQAADATTGAVTVSAKDFERGMQLLERWQTAADSSLQAALQTVERHVRGASQTDADGSITIRFEPSERIEHSILRPKPDPKFAAAGR